MGGLAVMRSPAQKAAAEAQRKTSYAEGVVRRAVHEATTRGEERDRAGSTILPWTRKIESEVLGQPGAPKSATSVNVENGVVYLRGQLDSRGEIEHLISATKEIEGVDEPALSARRGSADQGEPASDHLS